MLLSLCIPTNGVVEWVFPVLDSIYCQNVDRSLFEVIVTDNGNNAVFKEQIKEYTKQYGNLIYEETEAPLFLNEIEAYKRASGELIKFVNHRTLLVEGALKRLVDFVRDNLQDKPIVYFSNGALNLKKKSYCYEKFDPFVRALSYLSSWSTGMAIWKTDFDRLPENIVFNELFPHTTILFHERSRKTYILDNTVIMDELPVGKKPKGKYDLFYAFAVEYPGIILNLCRDGDITTETFLAVKKDNLRFVSALYLDYILRKKYCSYDLSSYKNSINVFYSNHMVVRSLARICMIKLKRKILR